jgi:hypothetical protein
VKFPLTVSVLTLISPSALAHAFSQPYVLPMPYWLYIYGALAALLLSFIIVGFFVSAPAVGQQARHYDFSEAVWLRRLRQLRLKTCVQTFSLLLLFLCIATGLFGSKDPSRNFNMTFFWLVFGLGMSYASALLGDFYAALNPWRVLSQACNKLRPGFATGRISYPQRLAYWPALLLYMAFIWIELFAFVRPYFLAQALIAYTGINLLGVWLIGQRDWFRYGEFFSVFLRLISLLAPIQYSPELSGKNRWRLNWPGSALLQQQPAPFSLVVFIMFMLSSTAFDGLRETELWFSLFWKDPSGIVQAIIGEYPIKAYGWLRPWYIGYETLWLIISPLLYLAVFIGFVWLGKLLSRRRQSLTLLCQQYVYSIVPIAVVYHVTHYYTLLLSEGVKIRALISDPFGFGWDLFGTAYTMRITVLLDMGSVWYTQIGLILLGHVAAVWLAHRVALEQHRNRLCAVVSQIPMLFLMVLFTSAGLWILAQPLQGIR